MLEILRVTRVAEAFRGHRPFVDGGGHEDVDLSGLEVADGGLEGLDGRFGGVGRGLAGLDEDIVRQAVDDVDAFLAGVAGGADDVGVHRLEVVELLAVETEELGRAVDDGCEGFEDAAVRQGLDDDFVSDAVAVTLGDADNDFPLVHRSVSVFVSCR